MRRFVYGSVSLYVRYFASESTINSCQKSDDNEEMDGVRGCGGRHSFDDCRSHFTIDHASLSRRHTDHKHRLQYNTKYNTKYKIDLQHQFQYRFQHR